MPDMSIETRLAFLRWLVAQDTGRQDRYTAYREYYDGEHDTQLTARQRKYLQIKMGEEFNDNYCPIVVDALAERLSVTGVKTGDDEEQARQLWEWWEQSRMDGVQGIVHLGAIRDGDIYVITEWDNDAGRPRWSFELAYDGTQGVKVHYSKERRGQIAYASKRWRVEAEDPSNAGKVRRLNLYFPDRIEKWISHDDAFEGAWQPYEEDGQPWPIPWADGGQPIGVPVAHFKNRDQGYSYGVSELKDVIPLQNALNKTIIDLLAAADTTGFPLFYMLGDKPANIEIAPGSWIYTQRPPGGENGAAIGKISAEDLSPLIRLKDSFAIEIARVTRTPLSYFQITGQVAAEGTQKQQEAGLIARARDRQVYFGNAWEDCFSMGRKLARIFGSVSMDEEQIISTQWADPETRNEKEHREALKLELELGVPSEMLWAKLGYNADEIAQMKAMRGEEMEASSNIGGELLRAFERGE